MGIYKKTFPYHPLHWIGSINDTVMNTLPDLLSSHCYTTYRIQPRWEAHW